MPVTPLRKACVRPPEVAKIKIKIKININIKIKITGTVQHKLRAGSAGRCATRRASKKNPGSGGGIRVKTIRSKTKVRGP
ncbi:MULTISPECIES: hypothetical protein [unclassified Pseudomonas]|uniref:hypothetical protein n=1 Tax=unclassified Pseudomonas TaxID=196821 RepID=UPI003132EB5B